MNENDELPDGDDDNAWAYEPWVHGGACTPGFFKLT